MFHYLNVNLPQGVKAIYTDRVGELSEAPYGNFNLGDHVGDSHSAVIQNRQSLPFNDKWQWLSQVHGTNVKTLKEVTAEPYQADAAYTQAHEVGCIVMTADCLPVLLWSDDGREIAAVHAGWRGLAAGILEKAMGRFEAQTASVHAWVGPCISQRYFEVGQNVIDTFDESEGNFFKPHTEDKWFCDLQGIAIQQLTQLGTENIQRDERCTYHNSTTFYSHRRQNPTGRQAFGIIKSK